MFDNIVQEPKSYRIALLGLQKVGKTTLRKMLQNEPFSEVYEPTVGIEETTIQVQINKGTFVVHLIDVSADQNMEHEELQIPPNIDGVINMCSVTSIASVLALLNYGSRLIQMGIPQVSVFNQIDHDDFQMDQMVSEIIHRLHEKFEKIPFVELSLRDEEIEANRYEPLQDILRKIEKEDDLEIIV